MVIKFIFEKLIRRSGVHSSRAQNKKIDREAAWNKFFCGYNRGQRHMTDDEIKKKKIMNNKYFDSFRAMRLVEISNIFVKRIAVNNPRDVCQVF